MKKIVELPEYKEEMAKLNMPMDFIPGAEFTKLLLDQHKLWSDLWEADPWLQKPLKMKDKDAGE